MTSKDSSSFKIYRHAFALSLMQSFPVMLVSLAVILLLVPVSTAGIPEFSIFNLDYTHHQMLFRFFHDNVTLALNAAIILASIILGIFQFKFLLIKRSSDAYLSVGIKRRKLFIINFMAGVLQIFFIILIPFSISLLLNIITFSELGGLSLMLKCYAYVSCGFFLLSLVSFTISCLCCCLIGTVFEAITFSFALLSIPSIVFYGINALTKHLLLGNCFGAAPSTTSAEISPGILWQLSYLNPVLFFYNASKTYSSNYVRFDGYVLPQINYLLPIGWAIFTVILAFISIFALSKRKAEIAGISGKNPVLSYICTAALSFLGFSAIIDIASDISVIGALTVGFIVLILVYVIFKIFIFRSKEKPVKALFPLPVLFVCTLIITIVIMTGGFGYSSRIPDIADIKAAEITYVGSPNYLNGNITGSSDGTNYYILSSYTFKTSDDLQKIINLHKAVINSGKGSFETNKKSFKNTTIPYDITIKYTLKNGKTITRYYDRTTMQILSELLTLDNTSAVKAAISNTINNNSKIQSYWAAGAFKNGYVYLSNNWYTNPTRLLINTSKRSELLSCIEKDVSSQSLEDRYYSNKPALGIIMFTNNTEDQNLNFAYNLENSVVYVTDNFTNTIKFLKDNNLYQYFTKNTDIESITFQKYDPYIGMNKNYKPQSQYFMGYSSNNGYQFIISKDFGKDLIIDDEDKLKELSGLLCNDYFMSDGGYLASVKIKNSDKYIYKFLPMKNAPDYIKKQAQ